MAYATGITALNYGAFVFDVDGLYQDPASALPMNLGVSFTPAYSELDLSVNILSDSTPGLLEYYTTDVNELSTKTNCYVRFKVNTTITGHATVQIFENNSSLQITKTLYNHRGTQASPNIYYDISAITLSSGAVSDSQTIGTIGTYDVLVDMNHNYTYASPVTDVSYAPTLGFSYNISYSGANVGNVYLDSKAANTGSQLTYQRIDAWQGFEDEYYQNPGDTFLVPLNITVESAITKNIDFLFNVYPDTIPSGGTSDAYMLVSSTGCTVDTDTYTFQTGGSFSVQVDSFIMEGSGPCMYFTVPSNPTTSQRSAYVTFTFYDTDQNAYTGKTITFTQEAGTTQPSFSVYTSALTVQSAVSQGCVDVSIFALNNGRVDYYTHPIVDYTGDWGPLGDNDIPVSADCVNWSLVHFPAIQDGDFLSASCCPSVNYGAARSVTYQLPIDYTDVYFNLYNTAFTFTLYQEAAPFSGISASTTEISVPSGSSTASTNILAYGVTLSGWTYITGGSFSVTATSGPNNTIIFSIPENNTNHSRTGYVYLTFYDTDGNSYGPITITFTQSAGTSPGPGPDPETGYVYTSLTISDNEQHRFFMEARPGVVYSAAGQYYKTIPACQARYSLYYVNSYGGVDVLPFKEKSWKKSDTITRFNYSRSFRNNTLEFENVSYLNAIEEEYELHTGWMSDEQSKRMHELIESTIVYLYDALEKEYTPVVMTDKKLEYKTYHNQGKKFYNYTVNCKASQSKERR